MCLANARRSLMARNGRVMGIWSLGVFAGLLECAAWSRDTVVLKSNANLYVELFVTSVGTVIFYY